MTFSLHQDGVFMSSQITHTLSSTYTSYPLYLTYAPWFSVVAPFYSLSQLHHVTAAHPSPGDNHQSMRGESKRTLGKVKMEHKTYSVTYVPGLSFSHWLAASTVIPLLPETFTPSIQHNLGLPLTHPLFTSTINTLLAIRY